MEQIEKKEQDYKFNSTMSIITLWMVKSTQLKKQLDF